MLTAIQICPVCVPDVLAPCCAHRAAVNTRETGNFLETTMNEKTRVLKKVEIDDAILADQITSLLMGDEVESRRIFIDQNAKYANVSI